MPSTTNAPPQQRTYVTNRAALNVFPFSDQTAHTRIVNITMRLGLRWRDNISMQLGLAFRNAHSYSWQNFESEEMTRWKWCSISKQRLTKRGPIQLWATNNRIVTSKSYVALNCRREREGIRIPINDIKAPSTNGIYRWMRYVLFIMPHGEHHTRSISSLRVMK
jgi:hypothetical protein